MITAFLAVIMTVGIATADDPAYEVWVIDQSDTAADGGGTLYIYQDDEIADEGAGKAVPEVIDLGDDVRTLCLNQTGTAPKRPHMIDFNTAQTRAIISFVATGHVVFMDTATRSPLACIDAGEGAHAAVSSPDETYVVVTEHDHLRRISTDYVNNMFTMDEEATLDLGDCTTPNGLPCKDPGIRPDNALICPAIDSTSSFTFATLRGGGLFVVDSRTTPMSIVAEYDKAAIHPNGCGGVESAGTMYINSGGGTMTNPLESDLYAFSLSGFSTTPREPNTPAPTIVFSHDDREFVDSHGMVLTTQGYLWMGDRAANSIVIVDTRNDTVIGESSLIGPLSADPAPDLMDISPDGRYVFISLRGQNPLTGNAPDVNNAMGSTPGLGIVRVEQEGRKAVLLAIAPFAHMVNGTERADPHGVRVRQIAAVGPPGMQKEAPGFEFALASAILSAAYVLSRIRR